MNFNFCSTHCSVFFRRNLFVSKWIRFSSAEPDRPAFFFDLSIASFEPNEHGSFTFMESLLFSYNFHSRFLSLFLPAVRFKVKFCLLWWAVVFRGTKRKSPRLIFCFFQTYYSRHVDFRSYFFVGTIIRCNSVLLFSFCSLIQYKRIVCNFGLYFLLWLCLEFVRFFPAECASI